MKLIPKRLSLPNLPAWWAHARVVSRRWSQQGRPLIGALGRMLGRVVDLLVPAACPLCGRDFVDLPEGEERWSAQSLCPDCAAPFVARLAWACRRCAAPLPAVPELPCAYCRQRHYRFEATVALGLYRGRIRQAVLKMKYGFHESLTLSIGELLARRLAEDDWLGSVDLVTPVPLHYWKRLVRGASAPELLAEVVGRRGAVPLAPHLLRCRRRTRKQGMLLPGERLANVRGAFEVAADYDIKDARVLLVDDVMTTGATANEAARALLEAGAASVRIATVARGTGNDVAIPGQLPSVKTST